MGYISAILMGALQGVAEFLPISSSGHLALFQRFFAMENYEETQMFFTVLLHLGTLISVFVYYWHDIVDMIREFFLAIGDLLHAKQRRGRPAPTPPARRLVLLIVVSILPLFLILPIKDAIETAMSNAAFVSLALIVTGCILYLSDRMAKGRKTARTATVADALLVGCAQAVGTLPGISRSGITISAGLVRGFDRSFAVRFSFLMSLPAVLGANILTLKDAIEVGIDPAQLPVYLVGTLVAAVVGYFAIHLVNLLSDKGKFGAFAWYCWAVGLISLIANFLVK